MENKNCVYSGWKGNGFVALFLILAAFALGCYLIYYSVMIGDAVKEAVSIVLSIVIIVSAFVSLFGFMLLEPNEARVLLFFGKYRGNFLETAVSLHLHFHVTAHCLTVETLEHNALDVLCAYSELQHRGSVLETQMVVGRICH